MRVFLTKLLDGFERERPASHDFLLDAARFSDVLVLDIQHWIDAVFALQRPKPAFPPPAGESCSVVRRGHTFKIQFAGPPSGKSIFQFDPRRHIRRTVFSWKSC